MRPAAFKRCLANLVSNAARFAKTGFNVGANYVKHYAKRDVGAESTTEDLHAGVRAFLDTGPGTASFGGR